MAAKPNLRLPRPATPSPELPWTSDHRAEVDRERRERDIQHGGVQTDDQYREAERGRYTEAAGAGEFARCDGIEQGRVRVRRVVGWFIGEAFRIIINL